MYDASIVDISGRVIASGTGGENGSIQVIEEETEGVAPQSIFAGAASGSSPACKTLESQKSCKKSKSKSSKSRVVAVAETKGIDVDASAVLDVDA